MFLSFCIQHAPGLQRGGGGGQHVVAWRVADGSTRSAQEERLAEEIAERDREGAAPEEPTSDNEMVLDDLDDLDDFYWVCHEGRVGCAVCEGPVLGMRSWRDLRPWGPWS